VNTINIIRLEFPSKSVNEGFARTAAAAFALQLDPTIEELGDLKTAVSEAVTNAIVHAYPDTIGQIGMKLRILEKILHFYVFPDAIVCDHQCFRIIHHIYIKHLRRQLFFHCVVQWQ
jgi:stage II sporulation protein AB (anti-sigma F factor)